MKKISVALPSILVIIGLSLLFPQLCSPVYAQKKKFSHAVQRSEDAARIIKLITVVPDTGLAKELIDRAEAVGVFPNVEKITSLFSHLSQGYGVISARTGDGWTAPAFYAFGGGGFGSPFAKNDKYAVILLFMTKDTVDAFEKGGVRLKGVSKAVAGPVGPITEDQRKGIEGAHILAYGYYNGDLKGLKLDKGFWEAGFSLNPDNNINKPLYDMKGREVLTGKKVETVMLDGILSYQEALVKYYTAAQ